MINITGLSKRELEVATWASRGLSNKDIAIQLCVTEKAIKFHLTNIYKKTPYKNRYALQDLSGFKPKPAEVPFVPKVVEAPIVKEDLLPWNKNTLT